MNTRKVLLIITMLLITSVASAEVGAPVVASGAIVGMTLDELLKTVEKQASIDESVDRGRLDELLSKKEAFEKKVQAARIKRDQLRKENSRLQEDFDKNEKALTVLQESLHEKTGSLGELFGVVRQVAGETYAVFEHSLISAEYPERLGKLRKIADSKVLPSMKELELLWFLIQQEIIESGKIKAFSTNVVNIDGSGRKEDVIRIGSFNATAQDKFLKFDAVGHQLYELKVQPPSRYTSVAQSMAGISSGIEEIVVDPTSGVMLEIYGLTPDTVERIAQGKTVGVIILLIGLVGVVLAIERLTFLAKTEKAINLLINGGQPDESALGRIVSLYQSNKTIAAEVLEKKIDEILNLEIPRLEKNISTLKILAAIAPMLGLLGTVTGMIETFQSITLYGTGDPKLMAGGISQALITTVLGLVVAVPMILLHSIVSTKSRRCINILDGQSAGLVAQRIEKERI